MSNNKWYVIVAPNLGGIARELTIFGNARGQPFTSRENAQRAITMRKLSQAYIREIDK